MKTLVILFSLLILSGVGISKENPEGLAPINVYFSHFRIYNSVSDSEKPGQKKNTVALRLDFRKPNKAVIIKEGKYIPQIFIQKLNGKGEWDSGKIQADIYQDEDGEYIASLRMDNLKRYFGTFLKNPAEAESWAIKDIKNEISRLSVQRFWKLRIICDYKIVDKDHITNDLGITRTRITPDGFIENEANKGAVELKFHIGELGEVVHLTDIRSKLYLVNKNNSRKVEMIPEVKVNKSGQYFIAVMGAPQLINFMKVVTGRNVTWNKKQYEEFVWGLQQDWKMYVLSKHDKRYDNYNFRDISLKQITSPNSD